MSLARKRSATGIACACLLAMLVSGTPAAGSPGTPAVAPEAVQNVTVEVIQPSPSITPAAKLRADVAVAITVPAKYLEVRLRLYSPTGRLVYQKTEIRSDKAPGRHVITYDHYLEPLNLPPGRYPIEARVLVTGSDPVTAASRLLIVPADIPPLRVALVTHVSDAPAFGADGRFTRDPAANGRMRDDLSFLSDLASARRAPLSLVIAPVLIEQLARIADGYELTDGTVVDAASETATRHARTLADLRTAVTTGVIDLLDTPYALPDPAGLTQMGAAGSLAEHWALTDSIRATMFGTDVRAGAAFVGDRPDKAAVSAVGEREAPLLLASPNALVTEEGAAAPGRYRTSEPDLSFAVFDPEASASVALGADAFYDALYERLGTAEMAVIYLHLGPDGPDRAIGAQNVMDWVARAPWLKMAPLADAAVASAPSASLAPPPPSTAPPRYWASVSEGRAAAAAYASAAGETDLDAIALTRAARITESGIWAGYDGRWTSAPEALQLANDVREHVTAALSGITIDAKDVTLSGSRGDVPLTLTNNTGKRLTLALLAWSEHIALSRPETVVSVKPAENFLTVPVNMGSVIADDLRVTVKAGDIVVAETAVRVRASHLDRLATVGMVVVVLVALLFFIRRRVRSAIADTIAPSTGTDDGPAPSK